MNGYNSNYSAADKEDRQMLNFLDKYDLTEKERIKFLANRSGLIKISGKVVRKAAPLFIPPRVAPMDNILNKIAANGVVLYEGLKLTHSNGGAGIKSIVQFDINTLTPIGIYASINAAARASTTGAKQLANALYSGKVQFNGYYWVMVERIKQCTGCSIWMKLEDRYRSSNGDNADSYSSYCKTCDNKRTNQERIK
jgi:hypothetical protein